MGIFGGSSKSRTTNTVTTTTNNTFNDNRQDNRRFIDNRSTSFVDRSFTKNETNIIDARQDNRQDNRTFIDQRSTTTNFVDESVAVADGGIFAGQNASVTINEIDGGAVGEAFDFAKAVSEKFAQASTKLVDGTFKQTEASFAKLSQRNLMIMAGVGLVAVGSAVYFGRKAA